jgi:MFS family permease
VNTYQFKMIYAMNTLSIFHGMFILGSGKTWAEQAFTDDKFLSYVLSVGSFFGALRFFWSFLMDKFSFKQIYGTMLLIQLVIGLILPIIMKLPDSKAKQTIFSICICFSYNIEGAHFVVMPTVLAKLFGPNGGFRVFAIGFSFFSLASILNIGIITLFLDNTGLYELGFSGIFSLYCFFSVISIALLISFKEKKVEL